jgi:hypothetical protein
MMRFLIALVAAASATGTLFAATALAATPFPPFAPHPQVIRHTPDGKPILLGSVTVSATALPQ